MFIKSVCEQSSSVWHSSLTLQNKEDNERILRVAFKIIMKDQYKSYQHAQNILQLQSLENRREELCPTFAQKCLGNKNMKYLFPHNTRTHHIQVKILNISNFSANTERLRHSSIINMQKLLYNEVKRRIEQDELWKNVSV